MSRIQNSLQENLLVLLCFDDERCKFIRNAVPSELFEGIYKDVAERVFEFIDRHKTAPKEHVADIFADKLESKNKLEAKTFKQFLVNLYEAKGYINGEYVVTRITHFLRQQKLKEGLTEAVELVMREDEESLAEADAVLRRTIDFRLELFDSGVSLGNQAQVLRILEELEPAFPTGIPSLDLRNLGPKRKCLHLFIGLSGRGKSWWFIHLGRQAVMHHHRVLHVTLEMSADQVTERYTQNLFAGAKRPGRFPVMRFHTDERGWITGIASPVVVEPKIVLHDPSARDKLKAAMDKFQGRMRHVQIKEFPTGSLTVRQLEAYLDGLEAKEAFTPDLLLVDYPDLMNAGGSADKERRHQLSEIYVNLRGLAVRRNIAVAVVSQSNREGLKARTVTEGNVGEDYQKIAHSDDVWVYNQTNAEKKLGLARLYIAKARGDQQQFFVAITQNYDMGQFVRSSGIVGPPYYQALGTDEE